MKTALFLFFGIIFLSGCVKINTVSEISELWNGKNITLKLQYISKGDDYFLMRDDTGGIKIKGLPAMTEFQKDRNYLIEGKIMLENHCTCLYNVTYCECVRIFPVKYIPPNESLGKFTEKDCNAMNSDEKYLYICEEGSQTYSEFSYETIESECTGNNYLCTDKKTELYIDASK